jgi:hypothetical protein
MNRNMDASESDRLENRTWPPQDRSETARPRLAAPRRLSLGRSGCTGRAREEDRDRIGNNSYAYSYVEFTEVTSVPANRSDQIVATCANPPEPDRGKTYKSGQLGAGSSAHRWGLRLWHNRWTPVECLEGSWRSRAIGSRELSIGVTRRGKSRGFLPPGPVQSRPSQGGRSWSNTHTCL